MAIQFCVEDGVATITLDRPRQRNAMNADMLGKLQEAVAKTAASDDIRVLRLVAAGPSFCAGSDLTELGGLSVDEMCAIEAQKAKLLRDIALCPKPVIAAVQGYAVGGGAFLAAVCDLVVAAEDVQFKCMEVPNGWITPWGMHSLTARMSARNAQRVAWGFEFLGADEALRIGLADYSVPREALDSRTAELAATVAAMPAISVAATKEFMFDRALGAGEVEDARLNNLFRLHCSQDAAQETFKKFAK